jgi:hypothetical protein
MGLSKYRLSFMMSDLTNIFAESSRLLIAVSMLLVNNLPCDIWFFIVEKLDLLDLSRLHEVFNGICLDVDVPSIATRQATKELYRLFISGDDNSIEMFIKLAALVFEPEDAANMDRSFARELKAGVGYSRFFYSGRDIDHKILFSYPLF